MPTITVKNIPEATYNILKQLAAEHHRSINSEIIYLIEKATRSKKVDPKDHLLMAQKVRKKTKEYTLSDMEISTFKNEGRP